MEQVVFKIGEVSARLGLVDKNSNTLRGWSEEFSAFLSAAANPEPGLPRRFSARDVQVLTAVRDYRASHLSYDEIRDRLRAGELDVAPRSSDDVPRFGDSAPRFGDVAPAGDGQALLPMAQVERLLAPLAASVEEWRRLAAEYRDRLDAREARIEALEQRLVDVYGRLNTPVAHDTVPPGTDSDAPAGAAVAPAPPGEALPRPDSAHNGHAPAPADLAIFPFAVVARSVSRDAAPAGAASARRPWWRVWR